MPHLLHHHNSFSDRETIVACCTPLTGSGALAVIRISGPRAIAIATQSCQLASKQALSDQASHTIHYGSVMQTDGTIIDQVMYIILRAPKTFTGEETVEISCHHNLLIIEAIIQRMIAAGARLAQRGEFTRQAIANNKIDLLQAEAINELIHAHTEQGVRAALAQVSGSMSGVIAELERALVTLMAWCEASFEFIDEVTVFHDILLERVTHVYQKITHLLQTAQRQALVRDGIRVVLAGSVNAGKSSLFNVLVRDDRAIVTPRAGTTRDTIEAQRTMRGISWTFIDTAGLRETYDDIEQVGIQRSWRMLDQADLILLVIDCSHAPSTEEQLNIKHILAAHGQRTIIVDHKSDSPQQYIHAISEYIHRCSVSSHTQAGIDVLEALLYQKAQELLAHHNMPFFVNQRHAALLTTLQEHINIILTLCRQNDPHYELVSAHMQQALECLTELTGKSVREAALDKVFQEFCVGK
jgi:tRNA modification GTPase